MPGPHGITPDFRYTRFLSNTERSDHSRIDSRLLKIGRGRTTYSLMTFNSRLMAPTCPLIRLWWTPKRFSFHRILHRSIRPFIGSRNSPISFSNADISIILTFSQRWSLSSRSRSAKLSSYQLRHHRSILIRPNRIASHSSTIPRIPSSASLYFVTSSSKIFTTSAIGVDRLTDIWIIVNIDTESAMEKGEVRDPPGEKCLVVGADKST